MKLLVTIQLRLELVGGVNRVDAPNGFNPGTSNKRENTAQLSREEYVGLAKTLITIYKEHLDKPRALLNEALQDGEELGYDFKLVRGLTEVLNSCSLFGIRSILPALTVRKALFEEAAKHPIQNDEDRTRILSEITSKFKPSPKDLEESMYADLLEEQQLIDFKAPEPEELFQRYNFALIISLLTYATRLSISYFGKDNLIEQISETLSTPTIISGKYTQIIFELKPTKQMWQAIFSRADLTPKEVRLLEHMARKMAKTAHPMTRS